MLEPWWSGCPGRPGCRYVIEEPDVERDCSDLKSKPQLRWSMDAEGVASGYFEVQRCYDRGFDRAQGYVTSDACRTSSDEP